METEKWSIKGRLLQANKRDLPTALREVKGEGGAGNVIFM